MKKTIILFLITVFSINIYAQENIVSLITTGTDSNNDKAVNKALRNAVEQAFGSFLVSKSTLVNDQLASDEILTVSSGNIVSYEVVSTITNPDNKEVTATVNSKVSLVKLKSFIESKGIEVDFKGKLFAQNIMMQEFYEQSETKALKELYSLMKEFNNKCFDYDVQTKEPIKNSDKWTIPLIVSASINENFSILKDNLIKTLQNISLNREQATEYEKLGKEIFRLTVIDRNNGAKVFFLRRKESAQQILNIINNYKYQIGSFEIDNSVNKITLASNKWLILQNYFKPVILNLNPFGGMLNPHQGIPVAAVLFGLFDESKQFSERREGFGSKDDRIKIYLSKYSSGISLRDCSFDSRNISNLVSYGYGENSDISNYYIGNDKNLYDLLKSVNQTGQPTYDLIISFKDLSDRNKLSTQFMLYDVKSLENIQKIDKYKIYPKSIDSF